MRRGTPLWTSRLQTLRAFVALLVLCCFGLASVVARAEPIIDFPTGAPAGTAVYGLAPGAGGSTWFAESPTGEGESYEVGEMSSSGTVTALTHFTTPGKRQGDTAIFVTLAPASDGGVWVLENPPLTHISPAGTVEPITLPKSAFVYGIVAGADGNAWLLSCDFLPAGSGEPSEACEAVKVEVDGHVTAYPLPSFTRTYPTADQNNAFYTSPPAATFAAAGGVWMNRPAVTSSGGRVWEAVFVSYKGEVIPANIPADARLVAPAAENDAWWQEPAENGLPSTSSVTFGQLMPNGASRTVLVHPQEAGNPQGDAVVDPGLNGTLLWAENTPGSASQTGFVGTITPTGETRYVVEPLATLVSSDGSSWVGGGVGQSLYQAPNGDIWMMSGNAVSVLTPTNELSTFTPLATTAEHVQLWNMEPASGQLWFSADEPTVSSESATAVLARADPLSPPPGLPHFPRSAGTVVTPTAEPHPSEQLAAPVLAETQQVRTLSGTVRLRVRGARSFVLLSGAMTIPVGSEVDATHGRVLITAATPSGSTVSAEAYAGRFAIEQTRRHDGRTTFALALPLTGCLATRLPRNASASVARRVKKRSGPSSRRLWVSEHGGGWGTNGRYVSTTVEGTRWLTQDECNQSLVRVAGGKVKVRDLVRNKTRILTAGQQYTARRR